ncbi:MAG: ATP-binding protein [Anaerolineae bacterium]|nr:ATP-binding protein [Anaerolineae bacterium]
MDTVLASGEALTAEKPVALKLDIPADLPMMRGDRKRLTQIFLNVVSNACKFTQEGFVKVTAKAEANTLHFTVQDTGPGIRKEDQSSVFDPFKQTHTGLSQGEGTGLGMPISKNLTEAHGGRLWFESTPGEGTTFFIILPIKSEMLQPVS